MEIESNTFNQNQNNKEDVWLILDTSTSQCPNIITNDNNISFDFEMYENDISNQSKKRKNEIYNKYLLFSDIDNDRDRKVFKFT